jgi:hypothetical protein
VRSAACYSCPVLLVRGIVPPATMAKLRFDVASIRWLLNFVSQHEFPVSFPSRRDAFTFEIEIDVFIVPTRPMVPQHGNPGLAQS